MMADSSRSSSVSTAVTTVGDSSSPHGFFSPKDSRYQVSKSIRPGLGLEGPVVAVDPVPRERAGPDDLEVGGPVGADGEGQRRPHHRPRDLEVGPPPDPPGRRHARLAAGRLGEADHAVADLGLPAQVGEADPAEGQADPGQPHAGVAHVAPAEVPVPGDPAVAVDLDEGPQLVGEPDGAGAEQALQVVQPVGRRQVVVGHAQLEGQLHHPLDGLPGDPRHRGHRGLDPHASSTSSPSGRRAMAHPMMHGPP